MFDALRPYRVRRVCLDFDPRDRDSDSRDIEMRWVDLEQRAGFDRDGRDALDRDPVDTRDRDRDARDRDVDPRDVFVHGLDLPRDRERELVLDGRDRYELNRDDSRSLAIVGAFRAIPERDLGDARDNTVGHLRDEGLVRFLALDARDRVVTLTSRGRHLLDVHRLERDGRREQTFYAGVSRLRELSHDSKLYRAYLRTAERLREQGADLRRVVLDHELKREYQQWLQARNRGRPDSDGRPGRDPERSNAGPRNTTFRTSTGPSTSPTSESSTNGTASSDTKMSRPSHRTIAARTRQAGRDPDSPVLEGAGVVVDRPSIRTSHAISYDRSERPFPVR